MSVKVQVPALEGWHTLGSEPHLVGTQCQACSTYYFPKNTRYCRNPECDSHDLQEVELSRTGKIWSYTDACYQPPEPFVAAEPFQPFVIAAVRLEKEQMVVMGQVAVGFEVGDLEVGMSVELVAEPLHETEDEVKVIWKWKPVTP